MLFLNLISSLQRDFFSLATASEMLRFEFESAEFCIGLLILPLDATNFHVDHEIGSDVETCRHK